MYYYFLDIWYFKRVIKGNHIAWAKLSLWKAWDENVKMNEKWNVLQKRKKNVEIWHNSMIPIMKGNHMAWLEPSLQGTLLDVEMEKKWKVFNQYGIIFYVILDDR